MTPTAAFAAMCRDDRGVALAFGRAVDAAVKVAATEERADAIAAGMTFAALANEVERHERAPLDRDARDELKSIVVQGAALRIRASLHTNGVD